MVHMFPGGEEMISEQNFKQAIQEYAREKYGERMQDSGKTYRIALVPYELRAKMADLIGK